MLTSDVAVCRKVFAMVPFPRPPRLLNLNRQADDGDVSVMDSRSLNLDRQSEAIAHLRQRLSRPRPVPTIRLHFQQTDASPSPRTVNRSNPQIVANHTHAIQSILRRNVSRASALSNSGSMRQWNVSSTSPVARSSLPEPDRETATSMPTPSVVTPVDVDDEVVEIDIPQTRQKRKRSLTPVQTRTTRRRKCQQSTSSNQLQNGDSS